MNPMIELTTTEMAMHSRNLWTWLDLCDKHGYQGVADIQGGIATPDQKPGEQLVATFKTQRDFQRAIAYLDPFRPGIPVEIRDEIMVGRGFKAPQCGKWWPIWLNAQIGYTRCNTFH